MFKIMKPGTRIVSVAAVPEPQTARQDLGGRRILAVAFWAISYGVRQRARRAGIGYRFLFMHPSGSDLALLADLIEQATFGSSSTKPIPSPKSSRPSLTLRPVALKGRSSSSNEFRPLDRNVHSEWTLG